MFWITKNHKLDFKGYLQRTPPVTKHFSAIQKVNDKAFLEKFRVKKSSILIGLENFGTTESLIMGWLGCTHIKKKNDQISTQSISIRIRRFPVQTLLGAQLDLGTQPHCKAPGDLQVKIVRKHSH